MIIFDISVCKHHQHHISLMIGSRSRNIHFLFQYFKSIFAVDLSKILNVNNYFFCHKYIFIIVMKHTSIFFYYFPKLFSVLRKFFNVLFFHKLPLLLKQNNNNNHFFNALFLLKIVVNFINWQLMRISKRHIDKLKRIDVFHLLS